MLRDDNVRCLSTRDHCYSAFESFTDELSMLFIYIFFCFTGISFIACCSIGPDDEYVYFDGQPRRWFTVVKMYMLFFGAKVLSLRTVFDRVMSHSVLRNVSDLSVGRRPDGESSRGREHSV